MVKKLEMVDLRNQYLRMKDEIDQAIFEVVNSNKYINGPAVKSFETELAKYLKTDHVIGCANGTDALQIALMALGLKPGDEVIVPAFTYVATAEVIALLNLKPVLVDVHADTFNIDVESVKRMISPKCRAIIPVHLFGQTADMDPVMSIAEAHNLFVVEDTAQSIGAEYVSANGTIKSAGTIGDIGTLSFYPSKNLGCYGDGGAIYCKDPDLAGKIRMITNHGQSRRYYHDIVGVNSRLDSIQAAVLNVKLKHLEASHASRQKAAAYYDKGLSALDAIKLPVRAENSTHVFHQYTIRVKENQREPLRSYLIDRGVPTMIYYPVPLNQQKAYLPFVDPNARFPVTEKLCNDVLSLPMHTELTREDQDFIITQITAFFA